MCWSETSSARPTAQCLHDYLVPASPFWAPTPVYPAVVADDPTADIDLYTFPRLPLEILRGLWATDSIGSLLVFTVVLFLLMTI